MKKRLIVFVVRWIVNSVILWCAFRLLGSGYEGINVSVGVVGFLTAGLVFSLINGLIKPILVILSLPAILISFGLFMIVVNGALVYLSLYLAPNISMSFLNSILTGILLSLVNYILNITLLRKK